MVSLGQQHWLTAPHQPTSFRACVCSGSHCGGCGHLSVHVVGGRRLSDCKWHIRPVMIVAYYDWVKPVRVHVLPDHQCCTSSSQLVFTVPRHHVKYFAFLLPEQARLSFTLTRISSSFELRHWYASWYLVTCCIVQQLVHNVHWTFPSFIRLVPVGVFMFAHASMAFSYGVASHPCSVMKHPRNASAHLITLLIIMV